MRGLTRARSAISLAAGLLLGIPAAPAFSAAGQRNPGSPAASAAAGSWTRLQTGTSLNLNDVYGSAASTFAVGPNGSFLFFDGSAWRTVSTPTTSELNAVWAGPGAVIAVGNAGRILRFDGATLALEPFATSQNLRGVWGRSADDIYAVGDNGTIMHYAGVRWTRQTSGTSMRLNDVWGDAGDVFAVGANGTIVRLIGNSWSVVPTPTTLELNGVWVGSGRALAVGNNGTILSREGGAWVRAASGTTRNLRGAWIASSSRAFAVGDAGTILFFDGTVWERMDYVTSLDLTAVNNGYASGTAGTILQNTTAFVEVGNLRITEIVPVDNLVEVTNAGPAFEAPEVIFSHRDDQSSAIAAGTFFEAAEIQLFDVFGLSAGLDRTDSDLWLYRGPPFDDARNVVHGMKYGARAGVGQTATAVAAGIWPSTEAYAPSPASGYSIAWDGFGVDPLDWYVDETPSPGMENVTPVASVQNEIVFPGGVQSFENMTLGDEVVAIADWTIENTSGIQGMYTARAVGDVNGVARGPDETSRRWLRMRDQDPRDVTNRAHTAAVGAPQAFNYAWAFDVNVEEALVAGANAPALVVQHPRGGQFVNMWGVAYRGDTAVLFVTDDGGGADQAPLYTLAGGTGIGQWVAVEIEVNLVAGVVTAYVNGLARAALPVAPSAAVEAGVHRLAHDGSGAGNVGTLLLDNVEARVDRTTPFPVVFTLLVAGPGGGGIAVDWDVVADEPLAGFHITRHDGSSRAAELAALAAGERHYVDTGVRAGTMYHYTITAVTAGGERVASREVSAALPVTPAVSFRATGAWAWGASVRVGWSTIGQESVVGYRIYRRSMDDGAAAETVIAAEDELGNTARNYQDNDVEMWTPYQYVIAAVKENGEEVRSKPSTVRIVAAAAALSPAAPNPFRSQTRFEYTLPQSADVRLAVYDVRGKLVATLADGVRPPGVHAVSWDGRDNGGRQVSAGAYFCKLATPGAAITRKMVVVR